MPIYKQIKMTSGALLSYHVATRVEVALDGLFELALVTVCSWPQESDYVANSGLSPVSVIHPGVPLQSRGEASYISTIEAALVATETSPLCGGAIVPAVTGVEAARVRQWARIKQTGTILSDAGVAWDGHVFDSKKASRDALLARVAVLGLGGGIGETLWTLRDNSQLLLSFEQLSQVCQVVGAYVDAIHQQMQLLRGLIFDPAKTTVEQVESVVWPTE